MWVTALCSDHFTSGERASRTHQIGDRVGPRSCLEAAMREKLCTCWELILESEILWMFSVQLMNVMVSVLQWTGPFSDCRVLMCFSQLSRSKDYIIQFCKLFPDYSILLQLVKCQIWGFHSDVTYKYSGIWQWHFIPRTLKSSVKSLLQIQWQNFKFSVSN